MRGSTVIIQSATTENRQRKKEERKQKEDSNHMVKIECPHLLRRAAIISREVRL